MTNEQPHIVELKKILKWAETDKNFAEKRLKQAKKDLELLNKKITQTLIQITNFNNSTT